MEFGASWHAGTAHRIGRRNASAGAPLATAPGLADAQQRGIDVTDSTQPVDLDAIRANYDGYPADHTVLQLCDEVERLRLERDDLRSRISGAQSALRRSGHDLTAINDAFDALDGQ
jgi:hypothetical protein